MPDSDGSWLTIEVDRAALTRNIAVFRRLAGPATRLMAVVKADAYGHGLLVASQAFLAGGADLLGVHSLAEAACLRDEGITVPILVLGPVNRSEAAAAADLDVEITVASLSACRAAAAGGAAVKVHLKVETGVNRQGLVEAELDEAIGILRDSDGLEVVGLSSHFADIEDTTDHGFAKAQMKRFDGFRDTLAAAGFDDLVQHMSCSAAALLWDRSHRAIARVGISAYGVWPSRETLVSVRQRGREEVTLEPALTWKVAVSQVRSVPAGETVGYGRSWKAMTDSRIAVLPVGYSDGLPRALSGRGYVLIHGRRAPLVGRICMNLCMADVTHIPDADAGDQAVLLGRQGEETITVEALADLLGTIPYEVLTLPGSTWTRQPL
ncbi:MAG: alanine racemase [Candidatus Krumholzibacteriota bacterium]